MAEETRQENAVRSGAGDCFKVSLSYTEMCRRVKGNETLYSSRYAPDRLCPLELLDPL